MKSASGLMAYCGKRAKQRDQTALGAVWQGVSTLCVVPYRSHYFEGLAGVVMLLPGVVLPLVALVALALVISLFWRELRLSSLRTRFELASPWPLLFLAADPAVGSGVDRLSVDLVLPGGMLALPDGIAPAEPDMPAPEAVEPDMPEPEVAEPEPEVLEPDMPVLPVPAVGAGVTALFVGLVVPGGVAPAPEPLAAPPAVPVCAWATPPSNSEAATAAATETALMDDFFNIRSPCAS